jgi:hypothetical protein
MSSRTFNWWRRGVWVVVVSLFVTLTPSLKAQTAGSAALLGTLAHPTGAVVPNLTLTATDSGAGQARKAKTGSTGFTNVRLLPPGSDRVKFEVLGSRRWKSLHS